MPSIGSIKIFSLTTTNKYTIIKFNKGNQMAKTGPNFKLSKTVKRMVALMGGSAEGRNQYKRMMIDAEYTASIVPKTSKKDKFTTSTSAVSPE
jgi:hypothetical protein